MVAAELYCRRSSGNLSLCRLVLLGARLGDTIVITAALFTLQHPSSLLLSVNYGSWFSLCRQGPQNLPMLGYNRFQLNWLCLQLDDFFQRHLGGGEENCVWPLMSNVGPRPRIGPIGWGKGNHSHLMLWAPNRGKECQTWWMNETEYYRFMESQLRGYVCREGKKFVQDNIFAEMSDLSVFKYNFPTLSTNFFWSIIAPQLDFQTKCPCDLRQTEKERE